MRHEFCARRLDGLKVILGDVDVCSWAFVSERRDRKLKDVRLGVVENDRNIGAVVRVRSKTVRETTGIEFCCASKRSRTVNERHV